MSRGVVIFPGNIDQPWPTRDAMHRVCAFAEQQLEWGYDGDQWEQLQAAALVMRQALEAENEALVAASKQWACSFALETDWVKACHTMIEGANHQGAGCEWAKALLLACGEEVPVAPEEEGDDE